MLEWKICQLEIFTFGDNGQVALGHVDLVSGKWLGLIPGYLFRKTGTDSVYHAESEDTDILVEFTFDYETFDPCNFNLIKIQILDSFSFPEQPTNI